MRSCYFICGLLLLFVCCKTSKKTQLSNSQSLAWIDANIDQALAKHTYTSSNGMQMPYRLFTPNVENNKPLPLFIFLHGRGDRGTDNGPQLYNNSGLFMNANSIVTPNSQAQFPCYILIPQCSAKTINEEWAKWEGNTPETPFKGLGEDGSYTMHAQPSDSGAAALELIEKIIDSLAVDPNRVYLMGKSMGGFGTWEFAARKPHIFAAAVPLAGYSDPNQIPKIKHIPFWIFHGNQDEYNPVAGSQTMYKLLKDSGAQVKYTEYDGAKHIESFEMAFQEADLIPWIFSQQRKEN